MSRNSGGSYSLPAGNPVSSGTPISATWGNTLTGDLATEMTDSLSRSGKGGMLAPLRVPDGTVAAPSVSFTSETGSGWFRESAGVLKAAILGTYRLLLNATGLKINGTLETTGTSLLTGAVTASAGIVMNGAGTGSGQWARANLPTVGQQVSTSCGTFSTSSGTIVDVTNLTVTITTNGRPVLLTVQPASGTAYANFYSYRTGSANDALIFLDRGGANIASWDLGSEATGATFVGTTVPVGMVHYIDGVGAGTYTYKIRTLTNLGTSGVKCYNAVLVAFEL